MSHIGLRGVAEIGLQLRFGAVGSRHSVLNPSGELYKYAISVRDDVSRIRAGARMRVRLGRSELSVRLNLRELSSNDEEILVALHHWSTTKTLRAIATRIRGHCREPALVLPIQFARLKK
jgi:hypothetical protein